MFKNLFKFKRSSLFLTVFIFALSLIPNLWFHKNQILLGYDNIYPLNALDFLRDRLFSWSSIQGFGYDQSGQQGSLMIHFIDSIPQFLGLSTQLSQRITFCFWFFMLIFSAYFLVLRLEKYGFINNRYLKYIFPVLYSVNFYVLQAWWVVERTKFSLMVATPLILSLLLSYIKFSISKKSVVSKAIIAAGILTVLNGGGWGGFALYGGLLVVLLSFFVFYSAVFLYKNKRQDLISLSIFMASFFVFYIFLNAYTLLPFIFSTLKSYSVLVAGTGGVEGLISWTRYISENTSFINLLRLQGIPDWYNSPYHPYAAYYLQNTPLIVLSFIFPIFIFLSLLVRKEAVRKIMPFLIFLLLISLFFTAGAHSPLGFIYEIFMRRIPGFIIFRSAFFKFGYAFWLVASLLIGIFLSQAIEYVVEKFKKMPLIAVLLPVLIIAFIVSYHFPFITGDIFRIDKNDVYSRVELPSYVGDFSSWWKQNGTNSKVLLLPKLNDNWLFEQYKWHYLSLFPVLGNFADNGLVENSDSLNGQEISLINNLYAAINNKDYGAMDEYSSSFGIRYFLVRKDFYYNISDQSTENPVISESNISGNPAIEPIKTFGQWVLYGYKYDNPLFFTTNQAVSFEGSFPNPDFLPKEYLPLQSSIYDAYPFFFAENLISATCISCQAETEQVDVQIPKPSILTSSSLYDLVRLKDKLASPKDKSYEGKISDTIGQTLKDAGQFSELITQDQGETYVSQMKDAYIGHIASLSNEFKNISSKTSNPYSIIVSTEQYLDAQTNYLADLLQRETVISYQTYTQKIIYELNNLNDKLQSIYGPGDFNRKKYYSFEINNSGKYFVKIPLSSVGFIGNEDIGKITVQFDSNAAVQSTVLNGKFLVSQEVLLQKGSHVLRINLPDSKNLISYTKEESISGNVCFSSFVNNFSNDSSYSLSFSSRNNFDPDFFYFIDSGRVFSPVTTGKFPIAGNQVNQKRIIISQSSVHLDSKSNTLRISFCAPSLTQSSYQDNISDLKLAFLSEPEVVLEGNINNVQKLALPAIYFKQLNPDHYKVFVNGASDPFLLVFTQRYSDGWVASTGGHIEANGFENTWAINKKGNYTIDIEYKPQKYFYIGALISAVSFILLILVFLKLRRDK